MKLHPSHPHWRITQRMLPTPFKLKDTHVSERTLMSPKRSANNLFGAQMSDELLAHGLTEEHERHAADARTRHLTRFQRLRRTRWDETWHSNQTARLSQTWETNTQKQQENAKLYPTSSVEGSNSINASVTMIPATKESMNCDPQHHGREMGAQRREQGCEARGKEHG
jgi:hypothetical protein